MFSHTTPRGRIARIVAAAIVATTFGVQASHAQVAADDVDVPSVIVKYDDLNLGTEEGSRALYNRLEFAAQRVCPRVGYVTELQRNEDARRCVTASVERAAKQIKSPKFAEVAASRLR
jgi:UrcA family protein